MKIPNKVAEFSSSLVLHYLFISVLSINRHLLPSSSHTHLDPSCPLQNQAPTLWRIKRLSSYYNDYYCYTLAGDGSLRESWVLMELCPNFPLLPLSHDSACGTSRGPPVVSLTPKFRVLTHRRPRDARPCERGPCTSMSKLSHSPPAHTVKKACTRSCSPSGGRGYYNPPRPWCPRSPGSQGSFGVDSFLSPATCLSRPSRELPNETGG